MFCSVTSLHGNQIIELVLRREENGSSVGANGCGAKELGKN